MQPPLLPAHVDYYSAALFTWLINLLRRLATAVAILIVGYLIAAWAGRASRSMLARSQRLDVTVQPIAAVAIRYAIMILVIVAALGQLGIQTASLLAVLGAAGLAIGLALQGTLTNIAAGIMLLWLRPFRIGDYIEVPTNNIAGRVIEMGLFVCHLESAEGVFVFAPNSAIWNAALRNQSRIAGRLISFRVALPPTAPIDKARGILFAMLKEDARVAKDPAPEVFLDSFDATAGVTLNCTFHVVHEHSAELQRDIIERANQRLAQSEVGAPRSVTRLIPAVSDPSRLILS